MCILSAPNTERRRTWPTTGPFGFLAITCGRLIGFFIPYFVASHCFERPPLNLLTAIASQQSVFDDGWVEPRRLAARTRYMGLPIGSLGIRQPYLRVKHASPYSPLSYGRRSSSSRVTVSGLNVNSNCVPWISAGRELNETCCGSSRLFITSEVPACTWSSRVRMAPSDTPACSRRSGSYAQLSGKYRRQSTGRLAVFVFTDKLTATRQFSCLPTCPQYCRATPTECVPFFTNPVSSTTQAPRGNRASSIGMETRRYLPLSKPTLL